MTETKQRVPVGVCLLLINGEGEFLLHKRKGAHAGGTWAPPGGAIDPGEEPVQCVYRELQEEAGLVCDMPFRFDSCPWVNTIFDSGQQWVTLYFVAASSGQAPKVMEPEKNEGWGWFTGSAFPQPIFPPLEQILRHITIFERSVEFDNFVHRSKEISR